MTSVFLTSLAFLIVFWIGFFLAGALACGKRADEDADALGERLQRGEALRLSRIPGKGNRAAV